MKNIKDYRKIYSAILDELERHPAPRQVLIKAAIDSFKLTKKELSDNSTNGRNDSGYHARRNNSMGA